MKPGKPLLPKLTFGRFRRRRRRRLLLLFLIQHLVQDVAQWIRLWLILLLSVFGWMISSRIVRGMTMSLREREFVAALSGCCAQRAALFEPVAESASLEAAVGHALASASGLPGS